MQRALSLAEHGLSTTHPNPRVGCVIVQQGEVVGEGFHRIAGDPHAEVNALKVAGEAAKNADVYVTLEPCCHHGKTPPCTDALINAGVRRVVVAMRDPNPLVEGGGFARLINHGIQVEYGLLEEQARWLNRGFISRMVRQRPWIIAKTAATLDGRTAAHDGESKWITGESARHQVQLIRSQVSAVITGIGTVLADDPSLNVRLSSTARQPYRVVLDSQLRIPLSAQIFGTDEQLLIFTSSNDSAKIAAVTAAGANVITVSENQSGQLDLEQVLIELANWQCNEVLLEAGQCLTGAFVRAGWVDELRLFYAPSILGEHGKAMYQFDSPLNFVDRSQFDLREVGKVGNDIHVSLVNPLSQNAVIG